MQNPTPDSQKPDRALDNNPEFVPQIQPTAQIYTNIQNRGQADDMRKQLGVQPAHFRWVDHPDQLRGLSLRAAKPEMVFFISHLVPYHVVAAFQM